MQRTWIFIVTLSIVYDETTTASTSTESKKKHIKELENIKSELYSKINEAINDSVTALEKNNDTDSLLAVGSMIELKKQVDQLNATSEVDTNLEDLFKAIVKVEHNSSDADIGGENATPQKPSTDAFSENGKSNSNNLRRASAVVDNEYPEIRVDLNHLYKILEGKDGKGTKIVKEHYLEIKKKAEDWILQRQKEKKKIKAHKMEMLKLNEKCPNYGIQNKKKKLTRRKKKKQIRKNKTFPCCRKCCKRSYMGCL